MTCSASSIRGTRLFECEDCTALPSPRASPSRSCRSAGQDSRSFESATEVNSSRAAGSHKREPVGAGDSHCRQAGIQARVRHVVAWAAWWIVLFWLWLLLVGEWDREQVVAAAVAASLAAAGAELARSRTGFGPRFPLGLASRVPQA